MRLVSALFLLLAAPLAAQQPPAAERVPDIPQPVVLDWGENFRLYAPPRNVDADTLKRKAAEEARQQAAGQPPPPSRKVASLGPEDPARDRYSTRETTVGENRLNVKAPVSAGPVSLGASYGKYRAIPNIPTREVSADDMRVSLGVAF
jgi:hypothetical protein